MRRQAVVIGVGNYQGFATRLLAPALEIQRWIEVLEKYGIYDVLPLCDQTATRPAVIEAIRTMVRGATKNDQLVFAFMGHGRVVPAHDTGHEPLEEALILYPDGDNTLKSAELTDSDLVAILEEEKMPEDVDASFIIDSCFAGYFDIYAPPARAKALYIPNSKLKVDLHLDIVREFGSLGGPWSERAGRPVVVAACGRDQLAYEIRTSDTSAYMLFSSRATEYLLENSPTLESLVKNVYPLAEGFEEQRPEIRGNVMAASQKFPGEPGAPFNKASESVGEIPLTVTSSETPWIDIEFDGICCFAKARSTTDPYSKRILFPYDDRVDPFLRHFAFVEVREDDVDQQGTSAPTTPPYTRPNATVKYWRWDLKGHRIRFLNTAESQPLIVSEEFQKYVPGMTRIEPDFMPTQYHPRPDCFLSAPPTTLLDGYFDIAYGELGIIGPDNVLTKFTRKGGAVTLTTYGCRYTTLRLRLDNPGAKILLQSYAGGGHYTINLKPGAKVRIGSVRLGDLLEDGTTETPDDHFILFYNLAADKPLNPPLPVRAGLPVNFCSQTSWP